MTLNQKRAKELLPKRADWSSRVQLESYQKETQKEARRLSSVPLGTSAAARPTVPVSSFGTLERPGYRIEKLIYESEPGIKVPALLFVPQRSGRAEAGSCLRSWSRKGSRRWRRWQC